MAGQLEDAGGGGGVVREGEAASSNAAHPVGDTRGRDLATVAFGRSERKSIRTSPTSGTIHFARGIKIKNKSAQSVESAEIIQSS